MALTTGIPYREGKKEGREAIVLDDNHGKIMSFLVQLVLHLLIDNGNCDWKRLIGNRKPHSIPLSTY